MRLNSDLWLLVGGWVFFFYIGRGYGSDSKSLIIIREKKFERKKKYFNKEKYLIL